MSQNLEAPAGRDQFEDPNNLHLDRANPRAPDESFSREGLNNPHLGRNAIGCGSKIRFEGLSER